MTAYQRVRRLSRRLRGIESEQAAPHGTGRGDISLSQVAYGLHPDGDGGKVLNKIGVRTAIGKEREPATDSQTRSVDSIYFLSCTHKVLAIGRRAGPCQVADGVEKDNGAGRHHKLLDSLQEDVDKVG